MLTMADQLKGAAVHHSPIGRVVKLADLEPGRPLPVERTEQKRANPKAVPPKRIPKARVKIKAKTSRNSSPQVIPLAHAKKLAKEWVTHKCRPELEPVRSVLAALLGRIEELESSK